MRTFAALFAALVVPFVAVYVATQGAAELDKVSPVYTVTDGGTVSFQPDSLHITDIVVRKNHACMPSGEMYVATDLAVSGAPATEVLFPIERAPGVPYVPHHAIPAGTSAVMDEVIVTASAQVLRQIDNIRLVIACERPFIGHTKAYTNTIVIRGRSSQLDDAPP